MNVGVRELKQRLGKYLELVRQGETIVITDRGRPVARIEQIVPEDLPDHLKKLIAEGRLIYKGPVKRPLPPPIKMLPGDKTSTDYVRESRGRY